MWPVVKQESKSRNINTPNLLHTQHSLGSGVRRDLLRRWDYLPNLQHLTLPS